ncbi:MAG: DUF4129 domain-containing protein [Chloroflexota bacterium]
MAHHPDSLETYRWRLGQFVQRPSTDMVQRRQQLQVAWDYVRHELLYLSWVLMEVALLTPFSMALMGWARYWPPGLVLLWLVLLMLVPFNLLRLMDVLRFPFGWQQLVMMGGLLLTLLFSSQILLYHSRTLLDWRWLSLFLRNITQKGNQLWVRDVIIFLLGITIWSRGAALKHREFKVNGVGLFLRVGGLVAAPLIIWLGARRLLWDAAPFMLLFLTAGLTAVTLVRAEEIERRKTGFSASLTPRWLSLIFVAILAVIMTGGMLSSIISGQSIFLVFAWLTPVWTALLFGATTVLATLAHFVFPVVDVVVFAIQRLMLWFVNKFGLPGTTANTPYDDSQILTAEDLTQIALKMDWGWKLSIFLLLLLVVFLITWTLNYFYKRVQIARQGKEFTTGHVSEFTDDISLGQRIRNRLSGLWHWRTAVSIRHIYRQMNQAATASGYPRGEAETPYEYIKTLTRVWPENGRDIQHITEAYIKIRYGEFPETEEELAQIWQSWDRLQKVQPVTLASQTSDNLVTKISSRKRNE